MPSKSGVSEQVLSLPKGGGDLKGLGEKFSPDLHTGTATYTVPISLPSGRRDLTPPLAFSYNTGAGNGPFGLGWSTALPSVVRKTDKGIPRYDDTRDTFIISGWEDLVPIGGGEYRPRVDTQFARIRHIRSATEDYWVVIRKDGVRHIYGSSPDAQVYDDSTGRRRILAWHLTETSDTCRNRIIYIYKPDRDPDGPHFINQTYLKAVYYVEYGADPGGIGSKRWLYRVLFDYGEGDTNGWDLAPALLDPALPITFQTIEQATVPTSTLRPDPFSAFRGGFEVRTRRRCWRVSLQVRPDNEAAYKTVRTYYLGYTQAPYSEISLLSSIQCVGFRPDQTDRAPSALPPLHFSYTAWDPTLRKYENFTTSCNWPPEQGLTNPEYELVDLWGTGLPGVLHTAPDGYRFWRNLGGMRFASPPERIDQFPFGITLADAGVQLADMEGNASTDLLITQGASPGFYPNQFTGQWDVFVPYSQAPSFNLENPDVRLVDLDGDHIIDVLATFDDAFIYFH